LTGDLGCVGREGGNGRAVGAIFSKVRDRGVENVLQALAEMVLALCKRGDHKEKA
jgi:hypothetical protein